jgi:UDP:flavonoid glycosyltransferase YjiC (YdhE family)
VRVLFSVSSWPTHYSAMVPLGWALQASGHEVRVLCQPSQTAPVTHAGLLPVPVLDGMDVAVHNRLTYLREALQGDWPYPWLPLHPLSGAVMSTLDDFDAAEYRRVIEPEYARRAAHGHDAAVGFARTWQPDLVVHDPVSTEGLLAARVLRIPAVLALWGPVGTHEAGGVNILPDDLSRAFDRYGFGPFGAHVIEHVIDPCPASLEPPVRAHRLPARYIPYNGGGVPPAWLSEPAQRPRVIVSWSTALSAMSGPNSYLLPRIVAALADLDIELIITATKQDVAGLGDVPPSVRVLERCPLHLALPGCAVVIHHGGAGSVMTAIAAGVAQLAITFASEQVRIGERLAASGAGRHLPGHLASAQAIRDEVELMLAGPRYRQAAAELHEETMRRPTAVELVTQLDKVTRG